MLWRQRKAKRASIIVKGMTVKECAKRFSHSNTRLKELHFNLSLSVLYSVKRFDRLMRFDSGLGAQSALVERVYPQRHSTKPNYGMHVTRFIV